MGKFEGILLVSDFDGTIQPYGGEIPKNNLEAIHYFIEEGGLFTISTGRSQPSMKNRISDIIHNAPISLCNGAQVYDYEKDEEIWASKMPDHASEMVAEVLENFPDVGIEIYRGKEIYVINRSDKTDWQLERESLTAKYCSVADVPAGYQKFMMLGEHERLLEVKAFCDSRPHYVFDTVFTEPHYYEVLDAEINKAKGLKHLHEHLGIPLEKVVAIGDYYNDLQMIEYAGFGAAVKGAPKEVIAASDFVTCPAEEGAIACLISEIEKRMCK